MDARALERALRDRVGGEVRFDAGSRGAYSTDASNYRQVPIGVVVPRTVADAVAAVAVCREHGAPVVSRGGGTSLAGQTCNVAVVIDWSKYCHGLVSVDPAAMTCMVEPGIVLDELNAQLAPHRLMFGPKPATHDHCTLGGMIGNNSCGATAQAYGKTADNVLRLEVLTYDGERFWAGPTSDEEYEAIIAAGGGGRRSTGRCGTCRSPVPIRSGNATRGSRAACPATTWTRCCPSRVSTSPGPSSAARARWSRSCMPSCGWSPSPPPRHWSCSATRTSPAQPTPRRTSPRISPNSWRASTNG